MRMRPGFAAALAALMMLFLFTSTAKASGLPMEPPMFSANIEWSPNGYIVKGAFTEFPHDISRAETLYSLDGETYQASGEEWSITNWSSGPWTDWDEHDLEKFQNQTCLHSNTEPLKSYLAGNLDRFYVKLRLTRENGNSYETQAAVIERQAPMPVPEEMTPIAGFAPSIRVRTFRPFSYYGRYQITVSEDASPDEIAALLPDTLPLEISLLKGIDFIGGGIVDCPVTWKPLEGLSLTAGESVTIPDAAEEIMVPGGTMLDTPLGTFQLNEALGIDPSGTSQQDCFMDEVRLVLNVTAKDSSPTGALSCDYNGLCMAFHQKPTGAAAIRAYILPEGEAEWTELPCLPLLDAVNAQPSVPGSGYTYVLDNTHELYLSYMAACNEGREPSPFLIGMKIEGGVYDGKQLILPWPSTYDLPLHLPELGGSGGNEANAGADNRGDSTSEGQRPALPDSGNSAGNGSSGGSGYKGSHGGDYQGGGTQEGRRPSLLQDAAVKDATPSGGTSGGGNLQSQGDTHMAAGPEDYAQTSMEAQAAAGTISAAASPDAGSPAKPGTDAVEKSTAPISPSAQDSGSGFTAPSVKAENSVPSTESDRFGLLFAILAAVTAGLCTAGACIASVAGKSAAIMRKPAADTTSGRRTKKRL